MTAVDRRKLARKLATKTRDAFSFPRYAPGAWAACCYLLLVRGHSPREVEAIVRSKVMRWAGDASAHSYGRHTSADLRRYLDKNQGSDIDQQRFGVITGMVVDDWELHITKDVLHGNHWRETHCAARTAHAVAAGHARRIGLDSPILCRACVAALEKKTLDFIIKS